MACCAADWHPLDSWRQTRAAIENEITFDTCDISAFVCRRVFYICSADMEAVS